MLPLDPQHVIDRLVEFQKIVRDVVMRSHASTGSHEVLRSTAADTIYKIDTDVEPLLEEFCREWARTRAARPPRAKTIDRGSATVSVFFPETKVLGGGVMEPLVAKLSGPADVTRATVFEDQYISTGGQFYELIVGHDRFNADLRPLFYRIQNQPEGLCCHPYDCAAMLIAREAGVELTDGYGRALDGPMDVTSGVSWAGYANDALRRVVEPGLRGVF